MALDKIVLIIPPQKWTLTGFPSGLLDLRQFVRQRRPDIPVELLDLSGTAPDQVEPQLRRALSSDGAGPVVAGITTTTATYQASLRVARAIKALDDHAIVVLGGAHATADDEAVLRNHAEIDFVVRGEGERALLALTEQLPPHGEPHGISYRDGRSIVRTPPPDPLTTEELDSLALPLLGLEDVRRPGRCGKVTYVSARGCPLACSFCAVARGGTRQKSIGRVIADIEWLVLEQGVNDIAIEDNFFAQSPRRTLDLCTALAEARERHPEAHFTWDCQTRVESVASPAITEALAKAGCSAVFIGVENFSSGALRFLNKTPDPTRYLLNTIDRVVPQVLDAGMACLFNFQLGLPGETESDRNENLEVLKRVGAVAKRRGKRVVICPMLHVLYPGTALFTGGVKRGLYDADLFEDFTRWEAEEGSLQQWLGRHFAHGTGGVPTGVLQPEALTKSRFEPDWRRLIDLSNYLERLGDIEGLEVFKYASYLS